jgi:NAD(P)-dependent dehydrogenase (short-subunit alcohol dehydrogenase family)
MNFTKLRREFKAAGRGLEFAAAGRVAAQGQDVFAAGRADFFQQRAHLVARVADAGEVRQRRQPVLPLDAIHDFERLVARGCRPRRR